MDQIEASLPSTPRRGSIPSSKLELLTQEETLPFVEVDGVRIIPAKMIFRDAYDSKRFRQSFSILNTAKYPALIRIFPPTSKAFKMKPLPRGCYISSGMRITRVLSYTYNSAMAIPQACLSIYVNEKPVLYEIGVYLSSALISLKPKILNFGEIDVGNASEQMTLYLSNKGHKSTQFVVDLGRNDLELIVDPMKGTIQPSQTIEISVEILGSHEGTFTKEFWIKTERPQRVFLTGTFITPKLVIEHPQTDFSLTVIDFPRTYYGAESTRTLVVKNSSSQPTMFCTLAEYKKEAIHLDLAREIDHNMSSFYIKPKEGRLSAKHKYVLLVKFTPKKINSFSQKYCLAFIRVIKVNYRDGVVEEKDIEVKTFASNVELDQYSIASLHSLEEFSTEEICLADNYLRVLLYGEIEEAAVKMTPDSFDLVDLEINKVHTVTFNIKNMSKELSIAFKYSKVACIEMMPHEMCLKPGGSVDVSLLLRPSRIGHIENKVVLKLMYRNFEVGVEYVGVRYCAVLGPLKVKPKCIQKFNEGITPNITNEVGFLVSDVRFNSKLKMPRQAIVDPQYKCFNKNNSAIVAFPNDRPKSLRPWRSQVPCTTIFANIPRLVNSRDCYMLSPAEAQAKKLNKSYFSEYTKLRHKSEKINFVYKDTFSDYDVTNKKLLLVEDKRVAADCFSYKLKEKYIPLYIPLPPEKLLDICITPKYIHLGKIAPYTTCSDCFNINNKNNFLIHISIRALSNSVVIKGKKRITIGANKTKNIYFDCYSHGLGKYYVPVYIIVNDCHIFDATVFAEVVPTTVKCKHKEVVICPKSHEAFFEIFNPVNCDIHFTWEVQDNNYRITPNTGTISSRKGIFCRIDFTPDIESVCATEIYLLSQSGAKQIIRVLYDNEKALVAFSSYSLRFDDVPLNTLVTQDLILRNFSEKTVMVVVLNPNPLFEVNITPIEGLVHGKSDKLFQVSVLFKATVKFNCAVEFVVQDEHCHVVHITGNVVYPDISIKPDFIQIHKIVSGAYHRRVFRVTNTGKAKTVITFPFEVFTEFSVTDLHKNIIKNGISLQPDESEELFLEFKPQEPIAYSMFLPYVLNGIIGPPVLNNPQSLLPAGYLELADNYNKTLTEYPKSVPVVRIRCAAGAPWLQFSSLRFSFTFFKEACEESFEIINISTSIQTISLALENLKEPFRITVTKCQGIYECNNFFCKASLDPKDKIIFLIEFKPTEFGDYNVEMPLFVEAYFEKCPFNYLCLTGSYLAPKITCEFCVVYFQTIQVKEKVSKKIILELMNHEETCQIESSVDDKALSVALYERKPLTMSRSNVPAIITFTPKEERTLISKIIFSCTCGAFLSVCVKAAASDSTLLSYMFPVRAKTNIDFKSSYPFFPRASSDSYYHQEMESINHILEKWLFNQGFFFNNSLHIPDTIARYPFEIYQVKNCIKTGRNNSHQKTFHLPLVQLLINLIDGSIVKYITDNKTKPSPAILEGTIYDYGIYKNVISFLDAQGISVPQVKPEFLLTYKRYIAFKDHIIDKNNPSTENTFSEEDFYFFSKQCWIDLLLSIYKVFVFDRTLNPPFSRPFRHVDVFNEEFHEYYADNLYDFSNCNENEVKLLLWVEFHFEKQKSILWPREEIKSRKIRTFDRDICDTMPLCTLMVAYCPYLVESFKDSYTNTLNRAQLFHNACLISETWKKLSLSFSIKTCDIFEIKVIEMLMLLTFLYDVLPNLYPSETITIEASLGESAVNEMTLKNNGGVAIAYRVILFLNDSCGFHIDSENMVIPPRQEKLLKITYNAKSVLKTKAVMVLSGEVGGQKFAKSKAVNLIGIPNIFYFTEEYTLKVDIFAPFTQKLEVRSPYAKSYIANTYLYLNDQSKIPESLEEFVCMSTVLLNKVPRQFTLDPECAFDGEGKFELTLKLCFITYGPCSYFVYFLNREVGDFCIKITVQTNLSKKTFESLQIKLPLNFHSDTVCKCKRGVMNSLCPRIVHTEIPCRNSFLIQGLMLMIATYADDVENCFWKKHLELPKGIHIFRSYLENTFDDILVPIKEVLSQSVRYIVVVNSKKYSTKDSLLINDVTEDGKIRVPIHLNTDIFSNNETLTLTADHGKEIRKYKLIFLAK